MGLHHTAHYLKSKGRGNDTMLVHMTPGEVKGLQAIALRHGGSLTINPDTGLPEAGFLEQILPVVAAAGLTYLTAGAAAPTLATALGSATAGGIAAGALSGAAISGGMAAIQGKDAGKAALMGGIGGGISGGLGAYDAANVFNAPNLLAEGTQKSAMTAGLETASALNPQAGGFQQVAGDQLIPTEQGNLFLPGGSAQSSVNIGPNIPEQFAPGTASTFVPSSSAPSVTPSYYSGLGSGTMDTAKKAGIQALPAVAGAMGSETYDQQLGPQTEEESRLRRLSPNFKAYEPPRPNPYYSAQYPTYAAEGGIMQSYQAGGPVERMSMANTAMNPQGGLYPMGMIDKTQYAVPIQRPVSAEMVSEVPAYERSNPMLMNTGGSTKLPKGDPGLYRDTDPTTRSQDSFTAALTRLNAMQKKANIKSLPGLKAAAQPLGNIEEAAKGGIMSSLGGYSDGGRMLKGPGDGMSDSIPASIGNKQPARLADGEFVVPADVVSHLGNGSTDAGARKLYTMMDKIRKARTGKKKQAPAVKANRYMPA